MIAFTGSTHVGRRIGELAGKHLKKMSLELGGKNSLIVLDDADPDIAAANVAWGAYLHQGQICMASGRILVQRKIADAVIERITQKAKHLPVGDPVTGQVALGPLINRRQVDRVACMRSCRTRLPPAPDIPAVVGNVMWGTYNIQTGAYLLNASSNETPMQYKTIPRLPVSYFGPEELANQGSR